MISESSQVNNQKPLIGLRCLICGMLDSKPIEELVAYLGGQALVVHKKSQTAPDVVVSDRAGAKRLQTVLELFADVPVVSSGWVSACEKTQQRVPFSPYEINPLQGCSLSFTNIQKRTRNVMQPMIEELGGTVAPDMSRDCSHLVVGDASKPSRKLSAAQDWHIPIVTLQWLEQTLLSKKIIPISKFRVSSISSTAGNADNRTRSIATAEQRTSTVTAALQSRQPSDIGDSAVRQQGTVSNLESASGIAGSHQDNGGTSVQRQQQQQSQSAGRAEGPVTDMKSAGTGRDVEPALPLPQTQAGILEHMQIYLTEMSAHEHMECMEILRVLRGARRTGLSAYITHVIASADCQEQEKLNILKLVDEVGGNCSIVGPDWLRECVKTQRMADTQRFAVDISSWRAQYSKDVGPSQLPLVLENFYFCLDALHDEAARKQAKEYVRTLGGQEMVAGMLGLVTNESHMFAICPDGFPPEDVQAVQRRSRTFSHVPANHRVNLFWVKQCRVARRYFNPQESSLFSPIPHRLPLPGFSKVCVVISGFGDGVRRAIVHVVEAIGGMCLETVRAEQWNAVTHLLTDSPKGQKYNICRKRKIPAVKLTWLTACTKSGVLQPEASYLVQSQSAKPLATQDGAIPAVLGPTQAFPNSSTASQGNQQGGGRQLRRPPTGRRGRTVSGTQGCVGASRSLTAAQGVNADGGSLLLQLSQGLSVPARTTDDAAASTGPVDFRDLHAMVPSAVRADTAGAVLCGPSVRSNEPPNAGPLCALPIVSPNKQNRESCQRLHRFAEANGVEPDSILGGHKRKSDPAAAESNAPGSKRMCVRNSTIQSSAGASGRKESEQNTSGLAGQGIRLLAGQLPGSRCATSDAMCLTQPLHLTQHDAVEPLEHDFAPVAPAVPLLGAISAVAQHGQDPLRAARAAQTRDDEDVWGLRKGPQIAATQVAFSQKVDFLACNDAPDNTIR